MRVHHLNCVSACPLGGALMDGRTFTSLRGRLTNHCLLVEGRDGLILVDTGYGLRDVADAPRRLHPVFLALLSPDLRPELRRDSPDVTVVCSHDVREFERVAWRRADHAPTRSERRSGPDGPRVTSAT